MYHAADFSGERADPYGTRHYAVYFGLSVTQPKSPAILRTLVDLCIKVDDPNDLSRVAWGCRPQQEELISFLKPHLESTDLKTRKKAEVCERIFKGELKAFAWATERARERAKEGFEKKLPQIKKDLMSGHTEERLETLKLIQQHRLTLIMNEEFIPAFAASASDDSAKVRNLTAVQIGGTWIWGQKNQPQEAIDLILKLSNDTDRQVRYNAVYYGLSTIREKSDKVIKRLLEMALTDREANLYHRIAWGLQSQRPDAARILDDWIQNEDLDRQKAAESIYKDMTGTPR